MLRKLYVVVDCKDDAEKDAVQNALNELSNSRVLSGSAIVNMFPLFMKNKNDLMELFNMIRTKGVGSLLSIKGGMLIKRLSSKK